MNAISGAYTPTNTIPTLQPRICWLNITSSFFLHLLIIVNFILIQLRMIHHVFKRIVKP